MRLAFAKIDDWRSRWVNVERGRTIHRLRTLTSDRRTWKGFPSGEGITVCGKEGKVWMPGFLSRLSAPRCVACCRLLGIPKGSGAPYNDPSMFPPEGRALRGEPS